MMKKRFLTGTLAAVMAFSTLSTGLAFADEVSSNTDEKENRPGVEKMKDFRNGNGEQRPDKDKRDEELAAVIAEYYPEISDEWQSLKTDIDEKMDELRELTKPEDGQRPERQETMDKQEKPDFDSMTGDEIEAFKADLFEKFKARMENGGQRENDERVEKGSPRGDMPLGEKPDFDNMTDEEKAAWEAEKEAEKVEREAERQAFQTAIEEGDTDTIKDHLDTMLERMEDHLENIEAKIAEFNSAE